jgi:signal transduction histidine kinase
VTTPRTIDGMMVGPLARRPEAWLRIGATATAIALLAVSVPVGATVYRGELLILFAGGLAQASALPLTLVRPWIAAALSVAGAVTVMVAAHAGAAPWPWSVTTMITQALVLATLGFRTVWPLGVGTLASSLLISGVIASLVDQSRDQQTVAINLVLFASIGGAALVAGIVSRQWQTIRGQLASERRHTEGERALRLLAEEKTRIARELHDVIAHSMSIISIQATSAPVRHPETSDALRHEFEEIADSSRRALTEMRSLLSVLRDSDAPVPRTPAPRLSGISELVEQSQRSGMSVRLIADGTLTDEDLDDAVAVTGYRIVQEALSNVIRHAPGAHAEVRVGSDDSELAIVVTNTAGTASDVSAQAGAARIEPGTGLLGMRERAASVGGIVAYGPTAEGGYEVRVTVPLTAPRAKREEVP